jgi:hypothetical protein
LYLNADEDEEEDKDEEREKGLSGNKKRKISKTIIKRINAYKNFFVKAWNSVIFLSSTSQTTQ